MGGWVSVTNTEPVAATTTSRSTRRYPLWWLVGLGIILAVIVITFLTGFLTTGWNGGEIHAPGVGDFFPAAIFGEGTLFQFNRLTLARFISAGVLVGFIITIVSRATMVPTRGQSLFEMLAEFIRQSIGAQTLGEPMARKYSTVLATVFFGVISMNLTGFIPGINIAASSVIAVPIVFAVFSYITFIVAGVQARGGARFLKEQLFPPGVPIPMYFLLTPIEFFSTFIVRPATLAIRLVANMISGHLLLAITYFGTQTLLVSVWAMKPLGLVTFAGIFVVTAFEIFIACLQAYIFTILTAVYIKLSVEAH